MSRNARAEIARQTLAAVDAGEYSNARGAVVPLRESLAACLDNTRIHEPGALAALVAASRDAPASSPPGTLELHNETTLAGIESLHAAGATRIAVLNFASARNPGGGFLGGSQAQEESLARSSALYASQMRTWDYYERHRRATSLLYSDAIILSPDCPVFRDDAGAWLDAPRLVTILTCAAPNAGAVAANQPDELANIPATLARRAEAVLALAAHHGARALILGAWGCGVFRNDPATVARIFRELLTGPAGWARRFERVRFSVYDGSAALPTYDAFRRELSA